MENIMATAPPLPLSDAATIARVRERWLAALHGEHVEGLLEPLTDDSLAFPPHEAPLRGPDAMRRWHQANFDRFTTRLTISPEELVGAGDWALDRFAYAISLAPKAGGATIEDHGNCFWIWQRGANGTWRIARSIWNSTNPLEDDQKSA